MKTINFITPPFNKNKYSGGPWCILEYVNGLMNKGYEVQITTLAPSDYPEWFKKNSNLKITTLKSKVPSKKNKYLLDIFKYLLFYKLKKINKNTRNKQVAISTTQIINSMPQYFTYQVRRSASNIFVKEHLPPADVTIATAFETAIPTEIYGTGKKFYFMQHYEPFFCNEKDDPDHATMEARISYFLGLKMIANSTWLKKQVESKTNQIPFLCNNAIDHEIFKPQSTPKNNTNEIHLISYGGRDASWKGFKEMAKAVKIARDSCKEATIYWNVYGDALLPPDNPIASYNALGFLQPHQLADAYRDADILLSASWYESFPLFPLEAMSCGLAVITTQFGTEDYAFHKETAYIVEPKNPENIAKGIIDLVKNQELRDRLSINGMKQSQKFTWEESVSKLEKILLE